MTSVIRAKDLASVVDVAKSAPPVVMSAGATLPHAISYERMGCGPQRGVTGAALGALAALALPMAAAQGVPADPGVAATPPPSGSHHHCHTGCILGLSIGIPVGLLLLGSLCGLYLCCRQRRKQGAAVPKTYVA